MSKRFLFPLVLCLLVYPVCVPVCLAQQTIEATSLGTVVLSELAKQKHPEPLSREQEHESRWRRPERLKSMTATWDLKPAAATIATPAFSTRFSSVGSASLTPGDAAGAVGKDYVVTATNAGIVVHSRSGAQLASTPLDAFLAVVPGDKETYTDPRIAYDAGNDRWIVFGLRYPTYPILAVSHSGDPRGAWTRYRVDTSRFVPSVDFSRLALTRDTVVAVTYDANADAAGGGYPLSVRKSDLYALPATLEMRQYYGGINPVPVSGEESEYEYIITEGPNDGLIVRRLDQLTAPATSVAGAFPWGRAETPAPQLGFSRKLDTGFLDLEVAVIRAGIIYAVNATAMSSPTRTSIIWWKFDAETGKRLGGGLIDDPSGTKYYAYPSLAVNRAGGIMIAFSTFSASQYPSAGYLYIDPLGAISSEGVLRNGETPSSSARWGDYSTTVVDPLDDAAFWTLQEAAAENHWVAWWGKMTIKGKARSVRK
jgi:hypothetical protein